MLPRGETPCGVVAIKCPIMGVLSQDESKYQEVDYDNQS